MPGEPGACFMASRMRGLSGVLNAARYEAVKSGPKHLACYELESPAVVDTPAFTNRPRTEWAERTGPRVVSVVGIADVMLYIKRAHDRNHTGWYILLTMLPFIDIIWSIELLFIKGTDGTNQYGEDPRYLFTVRSTGD